MMRDIIKIDEEKCNGCGLCIPNCHEGALQIIDGKARLISDLFCDGLGACIGYCPEGAISIEQREAEPYDERKVMEIVYPQGKNVIVAHLKHLKDHNEIAYVEEALAYLKEKAFSLSKEDMLKIGLVKPSFSFAMNLKESKTLDRQKIGLNVQKTRKKSDSVQEEKSELQQWPVQLHLLNPQANFFKKSDLLLAADCVAFSMGNFHSKLLKNKSLAIACPKLDTNKEVYVSKLKSIFENSELQSLTIALMEVPCCGGLLQLVQAAKNGVQNNIPTKIVKIDIRGKIISEHFL